MLSEAAVVPRNLSSHCDSILLITVPVSLRQKATAPMVPVKNCFIGILWLFGV
jgi:hypothetical protein